MDALLFVLGLGIGLFGTVTWGWKTLPSEDWQFLASVPLGKKDAEHWYGLNLTYYGAFIATAATLATAMLYLLMAATQAPVRATCVVAGVLLLVCVRVHGGGLPYKCRFFHPPFGKGGRGDFEAFQKAKSPRTPLCKGGKPGVPNGPACSG